ncbi:sigma-70 family RNA polymerase sigma factor [Hyphobacterium sp. CCMP332]|nr:sigma-70 family RNA polymerase sigma factor [Hyphobacterium sp. CCMP332]
MGFLTRYKEKSDEELMVLFQNGDHRAFDTIYARYKRRLFGYFMKMLWNDRELSEDSLHDLFLKMIHRPGLFNPEFQFKAWIFKSAFNMCKNAYRRKAYQDEMLNSEGMTETMSEPRVEQKMDEEIQLDFLIENLNLLDEELRSLFLMRYQEEMNIKELAEIYDIPEGTVKTRLFKIRKTLSEKMKIDQH